MFHVERIYLIIQKIIFIFIPGMKVKPNEKLNSSMLQSPDDQQATYRKNKEQESKDLMNVIKCNIFVWLN